MLACLLSECVPPARLPPCCALFTIDGCCPSPIPTLTAPFPPGSYIRANCCLRTCRVYVRSSEFPQSVRKDVPREPPPHKGETDRNRQKQKPRRALLRPNAGVFFPAASKGDKRAYRYHYRYRYRYHYYYYYSLARTAARFRNACHSDASTTRAVIYYVPPKTFR